ncbi:DgyrCDS7524 [Dimorphilus gyrociliatus]|uniref:DgyrCDS7524 n=1 Tax=Dimorphilus gyrociliatus TaxID=2664684 RepID=A0A7I8VSZ5_9ANNE|nr:DgyrCDS7524 [Dimorphilus gyrociliatus]
MSHQASKTSGGAGKIEEGVLSVTSPQRFMPPFSHEPNDWTEKRVDHVSMTGMNFNPFSSLPFDPKEEFLEQNKLEFSDGGEKRYDQIPGRKSILKSEGSRSTNSNVAFAPNFSRLDFGGGGGGGSLPPMNVIKKAHQDDEKGKKSLESNNAFSPSTTAKPRASIVTLDMQDLHPVKSSLIAIVDLHSISSRFAGWPRSSLYSARHSRVSRPSYGDDALKIDPLDELIEWRKTRDEKLKELSTKEQQINNSLTGKSENKKKYEFSSIKHSLIPERTGFRRLNNQ